MNVDKDDFSGGTHVHKAVEVGGAGHPLGKGVTSKGAEWASNEGILANQVTWKNTLEKMNFRFTGMPSQK